MKRNIIVLTLHPTTSPWSLCLQIFSVLNNLYWSGGKRKLIPWSEVKYYISGHRWTQPNILLAIHWRVLAGRWFPYFVKVSRLTEGGEASYWLSADLGRDTAPGSSCLSHQAWAPHRETGGKTRPENIITSPVTSSSSIVIYISYQTFIVFIMTCARQL